MRRGAIALAALTAALSLPAAGIAGPGHGKGKTSGQTGTLYAAVPASLLADATQKPNAIFRVIVTGTRASTSSVTQDVQATFPQKGGPGRIRHVFASLDGADAQLTGAQILLLAQSPDVASIVPDPLLSLVPTGPAPTGTYQNDEMWRQSIGADKLWGSWWSPAPRPPAIAIVDSGIDATRVSDFGSRVVARVDMVSDDNGKDPGGDPEGHGTMVAGIAAGASLLHLGVAPAAPLVDVRVAGPDGSVRESDVIAGLDWILQHKDQYDIRVVNVSLNGNSQTSFMYDPLDRAVETLWLNGVVVVASAGNQGLPNAPVQFSSPANDPFVITVGALDENRTLSPADDFRAPWSAYGVTADGFGKPELGAPGRYMVAPVPATSFLAKSAPSRIVAPGYMWMSGTSFAAPVVAGAAAQLLARHPSWTPDQVKGALMAGATRLADTTTIGSGELNLVAANAIASPPNPNAALEEFVASDPTTGLATFDPQTWAGAAASGWTDSGWTDSGWTDSGWTDSGWVSSGWTDSGWTDSGWTDSGWTE